jgi:hypothetical protein
VLETATADATPELALGRTGRSEADATRAMAGRRAETGARMKNSTLMPRENRPRRPAEPAMRPDALEDRLAMEALECALGTRSRRALPSVDARLNLMKRRILFDWTGCYHACSRPWGASGCRGSSSRARDGSHAFTDSYANEKAI